MKIIKINVYHSSYCWAKIGNTNVGVADFVYCVYLFGILVHSVVVHEITKDVAEKMFGNKIIE
jgi:hypothetical protein